jgi:hypothetical protein
MECPSRDFRCCVDFVYHASKIKVVLDSAFVKVPSSQYRSYTTTSNKSVDLLIDKVSSLQICAGGGRGRYRIPGYRVQKLKRPALSVVNVSSRSNVAVHSSEKFTSMSTIPFQSTPLA